ncbi:hypothetical protein BDZ91DRAFT_141494 [Kalaharituber pfeilii]|nr:hypothetical protein BDZ91DRAFT_141494 [Kalaharituber pfeilii]
MVDGWSHFPQRVIPDRCVTVFHFSGLNGAPLSPCSHCRCQDVRRDIEQAIRIIMQLMGISSRDITLLVPVFLCIWMPYIYMVLYFKRPHHEDLASLCCYNAGTLSNESLRLDGH